MAIREQELAAISNDLRGWLDRPPLAEPAHRLAAYHAVGYLGALSIAAEVADDWDRFPQARCRSRSHARWPFAIVNDTRRRPDQEPALHQSKGLTRDRVKLIHLTAIRGKNGKTR